MTALSVYNDVLKSSVTQVDLGAFYTPPVLSEWVAGLACLHNRDISKSILDPASGDGALLIPISKKCPNPLLAVDINSNEFQTIEKRVLTKNKLSLFELNTLNPSEKVTTLKFWKKFFKEEDVGLVVSNPPWGSKIWQTPKELLDNGFTLASGQFDSYELFMEMMIESAQDNTHFVFIIPDSIFLPEHKSLRELILSKTKIHLLSRLGEGFFKNVYRGACVLVLEKASPDVNHTVQCMRLNRQWRTSILKGNSSLKEAFGVLSHPVKQERFVKNSEKLFDIDILDNETTVQKIDAIKKIELSSYFISGRGVEVSKSGKVFICDNCMRANPIPRRNNYINCKCGHIIDMLNKEVKQIITSKKGENSVPLIVGEDIKRYSCKAKRYLEKDIKGIQYKDAENFKQRKLLIRKTGIGIKSSIDTSGAHTNQVVFHYIAKKEKHVPNFMTEYVQGILSSRVLMAYYLQKYGDNEWRSHPYITQKVISQLPIPDIKKSKKSFDLAQKIAQHVEEMNDCTLEKRTNLDIEIEKLVVRLFSLSAKDCKWVIKTLKDSQQLEPIRCLMLEDHKIIME